MTAVGGACDACLARTWLLERLSGHLDLVRGRIDALLTLGDGALIDALGGGEAAAIARELLRFDGAAARADAAAAGLELVCCCDTGYPDRLRDLPAPPAVLHVAGGLARLHALCAQDPVGVVGARRATEYGLEVAGALGRGLGAAGMTVVSGMAVGIDAAAHRGALAADGPTIAVLPGPAQRSYPAGNRRLHAAIVDSGVAISELGPGAAVRRWSFPARNRTIAALSGLVVVVEAAARSGALVTARWADELGRPLGAVPGRVTSAQAHGPNALLAAGAAVIRDTQDVLDQLFGTGARTASLDRRGPLTPEEQALLDAIAAGADTVAALSRSAGSGSGPDHGLAALAALELGGWVRRGAGGRFTVIP